MPSGNKSLLLAWLGVIWDTVYGSVKTIKKMLGQSLMCSHTVVFLDQFIGYDEC